MITAALIRKNMEVLGSDGVHVGVVDHLEGDNAIRLAKDDPEACGEHHYIPLAWVVQVEMKVHLNQPADRAKSRWASQ
jgi:hypothetical protein